MLQIVLKNLLIYQFNRYIALHFIYSYATNLLKPSFRQNSQNRKALQIILKGFVFSYLPERQIDKTFPIDFTNLRKIKISNR